MKRSEKIIKEYIVKPTFSEWYRFFWTCMIAFTFIGAILLGLIKMDFYDIEFPAGILILIFLLSWTIRFFIYEFIEVIFRKRIILTDKGDIYLKFIIYWEVNQDRCYLNIEDYWVIALNGIPNTQLIINRNNDSFSKRFFKNKIKLYTVNIDNREEVIQKGIEISEMFGINFWNANEANE